MLRLTRPTSPARRQCVYVVFEGLHKGAPDKSLVERLKNRSGRNSMGRITARHRGGGHKHIYRLVDFKRDKRDIPAVVERIERDPGISSKLQGNMRGVSEDTTTAEHRLYEMQKKRCLPFPAGERPLSRGGDPVAG